MAKYRRLEVYLSMISSGLMPLFYCEDVQLAVEVMKSVAAGGAKVMEITNRGEQALRVFQALTDVVNTENIPLILGIGSVLDAGTASTFINMGANFIVSPVNNLDVAKVCNRRKIGYIPGCGSVNEISEAEEVGAEIVKIFPGNGLGGPQFIKDLLGPMPWSNIMPTGGVDVTEISLRDWINAGASCLGIGSRLITKENITRRNFDDISKKVEFCLNTIRVAREDR